MRIDVLTLFPGIFESFLRESLIGKALEKKLFQVRVVDIREFTADKHRTADDRPFGGGPGMLLLPEPLAGAIEFAKKDGSEGEKQQVVMLTPSGLPFNQDKAEEFTRTDHLILICGRYEGVDARIIKSLVDEEISLGDFVLSGGEVPAMAVIESVTRLLPGVLGTFESVAEETFSDGLLEYPQYTRPREFQGMAVPDVLLSGNHEEIRKWRRAQSLELTFNRRPEMLDKAGLTEADLKILDELKNKLSDDEVLNQDLDVETKKPES